MSLDSFVFSLRTRHKVVWEIDDLDRAVELGREVLSLCPQGHSHRPAYSDKLSSYLTARYKQLGEVDDITEAIALAKEALSHCPPLHEHRAVALNTLAFSLCARYDTSWEIEDLDEAIKLTREALSFCTPDHPRRRTYLKNLASYLCIRYDRLEDLDNLNETIDLAGDVLPLISPGHPDLPESSDALAFYLFSRYKQLGSLGDLTKAITMVRGALLHYPLKHPNHPMSLHNLTFSLGAQFERLGELNGLTEVITLSRQALSLSPPGHPDWLTILRSLLSSLQTGYKLLGQIDHLNEAVVLAKDALPYCPQGHLDRLTYLNGLSLSLRARYEQLGNIDDLNEAIIIAKDALYHCPPGHPSRPTYLGGLSSCLHTLFKCLGRMNDLEEAVILSREVLSLCPPGHPDRSVYLNNLASNLTSRHKQIGGVDDLNEAIDLAREALSLRPPGPVNDLADALFSRHTYLRGIGDVSAATKDEQELFRLYTRLQHRFNVPSSHDLSAAEAWVNTAEEFNHPTILLAYETVLRLLVQHFVSLPSLPQPPGLLKPLSSSLAADGFSACLRNQSLTKAVELLEQGRAAFWNQLTGLRSPLDDLIASGPQGKVLAEKYACLTSLVRIALNSPDSGQHDRVRDLNLELQKVVSEIREFPDFSRFLLPPLFSELQSAARDGPVIIMNASKYGCDALVVFADKNPVHIPLPVKKEDVQKLSSRLRTLTRGVKKMDAKDAEKAFVAFLRELWEKLVSHIADELRKTRKPQSRIWWCPTAEFSLLPLHAAGPYRQNQEGISDLYISSYTTTLTALIRARRPGLTDSAREKKHFIAIGQVAPRELSHVGTELDNISQFVQDVARFTRIEGEDARVSKIAEELGKNEWIHFACPGVVNQERPFESAFALHDGQLTIQRIVQCRPPNPEFAFLPADCATVGDQESLGDVIHPAAAMQIAGFHSVIGTMWPVDGSQANKVTSKFYELMISESGHLDCTRAARELHTAMKEVDVPMCQRIFYIHLGA